MSAMAIPLPGVAVAERTRTLTDQDPDLAARHAAYQQRISKRKEKRKSRSFNDQQFLSNVQETDDDIAYRFNFTIVGPSALRVVQQICASRIHTRLGGMGDAADASSASFSNVKSNNNYRCLTEVFVPLKDKGPIVRKVCKLALTPLGFDQDMPIWESRQEALGTAIVYVLWIDGQTQDGVSNFDDQLRGLSESLALLRSTTQSKLRPVKALLLLHSGGQGRASTLEKWALSLSDFEQSNGDFWKFGPMGALEAEQLHGAFSEMASTRLKYYHSDNVLPGDEEKTTEKSADEQELFKFKPSAGDVMFQRARSTSGMSSGSEQELPPAFQAEASGSECSETAIELHRMAFGLGGDGDNDGDSATTSARSDCAPTIDKVNDSCAMDHKVEIEGSSVNQVQAEDQAKGKLSSFFCGC